MKFIIIAICAYLGFQLGIYISHEMPLLATLLGNDGTPSWLGRGSMPSGTLPVSGAIVGALVGMLISDKIFQRKE